MTAKSDNVTKNTDNVTKLIDCVLQIPQTKKECANWLKTQTPDIVADILCMSQTVYSAMINGIYTDSDSLLKYQQQMQDLQNKHHGNLEKNTEMYTKRIDTLNASHAKAIEKYNDQLQRLELRLKETTSSFKINLNQEIQKQKDLILSETNEQVQQLKTAHQQKLDVITQQYQNQTEHCKRMQEQYTQAAKTQEDDLKRKYNNEIKALKEQHLQQADELRRIQGENAIFKEKVRGDFDTEKETYIKEQQKEKDQLYKQLEHEQNRYKDDKTFWQKQIDNKDQEIKEIHEHGTKMLEEKTNEITTIVRNLTGTTSAIGRMGERFVSKTHARMNLGTYTDDSHNKNQGYADGTWTLTFHSTTTLCSMVEDKLVSELHPIKDIKKFEDDTRVGAQLGRINASILFSLTARVPGKPRLSMDMSLGVPTIWASRDADDALPAQALVELGFLMMAEAWPIISKKHTDENSVQELLQGMENNLECQLIEYEKMDKAIKKIEDTAKVQLKQAEELKKIQISLIQNVNAFRMRYPAVSSLTSSMNPKLDFWDNQGQTLMKAMQDYKNSVKGRYGRYYPTTLEQLELPDELYTVIKTIPNAFVLAKDKLKNEAKRTESKRPHDEPPKNNTSLAKELPIDAPPASHLEPELAVEETVCTKEIVDSLPNDTHNAPRKPKKQKKNDR